MLDMVRACILSPGFRAVVLYRAASWFWVKGTRYVPEILTAYSVSKTGAEIRPGAKIGPGLLVRHPVGIVVGGRAVIGRSCTLLQGVTLGEKYSRGAELACPTLGDNVTICAGAMILGGISIGDNAIVGANAVVLKDLPSNSVCAGVPAEVLYQILGDEAPEQLPYKDSPST